MKSRVVIIQTPSTRRTSPFAVLVAYGTRGSFNLLRSLHTPPHPPLLCFVHISMCMRSAHCTLNDKKKTVATAKPPLNPSRTGRGAGERSRPKIIARSSFARPLITYYRLVLAYTLYSFTFTLYGSRMKRTEDLVSDMSTVHRGHQVAQRQRFQSEATRYSSREADDIHVISPIPKFDSMGEPILVCLPHVFLTLKEKL